MQSLPKDLALHRTARSGVAGERFNGGPLGGKQFVQGFIADSHMDIQASRLMTIRCAQLIDQGLEARTDMSAIRIFVPNAMHRVVDRAIQVHGALGVSSDTPLEGMYQGARTARGSRDGPGTPPLGRALVERQLYTSPNAPVYHVVGQCDSRTLRWRFPW